MRLGHQNINLTVEQIDFSVNEFEVSKFYSTQMNQERPRIVEYDLVYDSFIICIECLEPSPKSFLIHLGSC